MEALKGKDKHFIVSLTSLLQKMEEVPCKNRKRKQSKQSNPAPWRLMIEIWL